MEPNAAEVRFFQRLIKFTYDETITLENKELSNLLLVALNKLKEVKDEANEAVEENHENKNFK